MLYFVLGVVAASAAFLFAGYVRRRQIKVRWWGLLLSSFWLVYTLFVLAMVFTLIEESAGRAALVSFIIFGFVSVVTAVLLFRFILLPERDSDRLEIYKKGS